MFDGLRLDDYGRITALHAARCRCDCPRYIAGTQPQGYTYTCYHCRRNSRYYLVHLLFTHKANLLKGISIHSYTLLTNQGLLHFCVLLVPYVAVEGFVLGLLAEGEHVGCVPLWV